MKTLARIIEDLLFSEDQRVWKKGKRSIFLNPLGVVFKGQGSSLFLPYALLIILILLSVWELISYGA